MNNTTHTLEEISREVLTEATSNKFNYFYDNLNRARKILDNKSFEKDVQKILGKEGDDDFKSLEPDFKKLKKLMDEIEDVLAEMEMLIDMY